MNQVFVQFLCVCSGGGGAGGGRGLLGTWSLQAKLFGMDFTSLLKV